MVSYKRCSEVDDRTVYDTLMDGFSDYIVNFDISYENAIHRFFGIDRNIRESSFIAMDEGVGVGVILSGIEKYDGVKSMRCGALCISPQYRGEGVAQELLKLHKEEAKEQNCSQMMLEVIVGNDRAIKFYNNNGYSKKYNWYIYSIENLNFLCGVEDGNIAPITLEDAKNYREKYIDYHISWSNEMFCIEKRNPSCFGAFKDGDIIGIICMEGGSMLFLHVLPEYRGQGIGRSLIKKALSEGVDKIAMSLSENKELEAFLSKNGFEKGKISQYEMFMDS